MDTPDGATGQTPGTGPEDQKVFDQEYVSKLRAEAASYRMKAKENADAVAELAKLKDASKTAEQKTADTLAALQEQLDAQATAAQRANIALKFGLTADDAALLTGDVDAMTALATRLAKDAKAASSSPREGLQSNTKPSDGKLREVARELFGDD